MDMRPLYIGSTYLKPQPLHDRIRGIVLIFVATAICVLLLLLFPEIARLLPRTMYRRAGLQIAPKRLPDRGPAIFGRNVENLLPESFVQRRILGALRPIDKTVNGAGTGHAAMR
jgi:hypothetical protein